MWMAALTLLSSSQSPEATVPRDLSVILRAAPEPVLDDGRVTLHRSRLGDPDRYFYPASPIKLCGAIAGGSGSGLDSRLVIGPRFAGDQRIERIERDDSNLDGGALPVRSMRLEMRLESDNRACNHCIEIVGPDGLNRALWEGGFASTRLWNRLSEARTRGSLR